MPQRNYLQLPINPEEGFPQAFQLNFNQRTYRILLYVNVLERDLETTDDHIYHLPEPGAFLVMQVAREAAEGLEIIFWRKLVLHLEYEVAELAFVFRELQVAKRNINGVGAFGSHVVGGVAVRWAL